MRLATLREVNLATDSSYFGAFVSVNIREHSTVFGLRAVARCGAAR
ncbi:MAG TPA: hypothetical protein VKA61_10435 [Sphingomicrobium sp.]|nr:hypothetical protein [Sphingomicrobium sp.]